MKMTDHELEDLVYAILRRCPEGDDRAATRRIVTAIIRAEIQEFEDLAAQLDGQKVK